MAYEDWEAVIGTKGAITTEDKVEGNACYVSPDSKSVIVHKQTESDKPVSVTISGYFKVTAIEKNMGFAVKMQSDGTGIVIRIRETT